MRSTMIIIFALGLISGCASTRYTLPADVKTVDIEFRSEFKTSQKDSAQILAFTDSKSCENHPRGVYMGLMCESRPGYACDGFNITRKIEADKPITLKVEYKFGDIFTWKIGGCNVQMSFIPKENNKYRALYRVNDKSCSVRLEKSGSDKKWVQDDTVTYDTKLCIWM